MSTMRTRALELLVLATLLALLAAAEAVQAGTYPTNKCVGAKMKAAAGKCKTDLKAWSKWDKTQDTTGRDAALAAATTKFDLTWAKAQDKAAAQGADCVEATLSDADLRALMDTAIGALVDDVNMGLDLGNADHAKCGASILNAAAGRCAAFLKAEGKHIQKLATDPLGLARTGAQTKAADKFGLKYATATAGGTCPTGASETDVATALDTLDAGVVTNTTTAPNLDGNAFTVVTPSAGVQYEGRTFDAICSDDSPYSFFVKRGTVNKLLMYYQGGGACWDYASCKTIGTCDPNVNTAGTDNPDIAPATGFNDRTNPNNPFKDWNIVFVSYCTCDVHWGENKQLYTGGQGPKTIEHMGFVNAKVAEKWAREHFLNPSEVFVTGSSAGAYGALLHGTLLHLVYPASQLNVLADAGNGVITQDFLENRFPVWHVDQNLPTYIPALNQPVSQLSIPAFTEAVADFYPQTNWAHYSTAFDGGTGGQTGFYNVMLNLSNVLQWLRWWDASCAWNTVMRQQALATAAAVPANYRYYIGTGSLHTMFGSDKVYTDTTGGVPTIVDWINAMRTNGPGWTNVEATNEGLLLPGDPAPSPLEAPFEPQGPDVVINCGP